MKKRIRQVIPLLLLGLTFYCVEAGTGITQFFDNATLQARLFNNAHTADLSISFLRILFGSVATLGGSNAITGQIFKMFNLGVLIVVSVTIGYTVITSVIGSAQDGNGAFSTRVSPWTLFRTVGGVSIMMPMSSGYSVIQTMVMKIVLLGIALANTAWDGALTYLEANNGNLYLQTAAPAAPANEATRVSVAAQYFSDIYENIWARHDTLCTGRQNCNVSIRVSTITNSKNLKYILTRLSDGAEACFTHPALLPTSMDSIVATDLKVVRAMAYAEAFVGSAVAQLHTMVVNNYSNPLFTQTTPVALPSTTVLSSWQASHDAWHVGWGVGTDSRTLPADLAQLRGISTVWHNAKLRQTRLASNIAGIGYMYTASMVSIYPSISNRIGSAASWYNDARHKGWLASGMYYSKFLVQDSTIPTISSAVPILSFGTSYSAPAPPTTVTNVRRTIIKAPPTSTIATTSNPLAANPTTNQAAITAASPYAVSEYFSTGSTVIASIMPPTGQSTGSTGSVINAGTTSLAGFSTAFRHALTQRVSATDSTTLAAAILNKIIIFDSYLPLFGRGSQAAYDLIPDLTGHMDNGHGTGWMYGVDPAMPISNLAVMMRSVFMQLLGIKTSAACDVRGPARYSSSDAGFTNNVNFQYTPLFAYMSSNPSAATPPAPVRPNCLHQGSLLHSIMDPNANVNVIAMTQSLGRTMIHESIRYYGNTIEGLYTEVKKLADYHFGVSTVINVAAAAVEAGTYGTMMVAAGVAASTLAEIANTGLKMGYNATKIALEIYVPLGTSVAAMLFTLGVILGVYIPMLPFLLFLFGIVAWLMSVTEAMVAAPLVALGITHPEGHDILGKAEQALMLMLGVFIRPITMLFGMIMAVVVSQLLLKLFHIGFLQILVKLFTSSPGAGLEELAVLLIGSLIVYIYVLINVVEQSFSLVYVIPERILRWVGGPQDQTGIGQLADQTKGEVQQASGQAAQGAGQSTAAPSLQPTTPNIQSPKGGASAEGNDGKGGTGAEAKTGTPSSGAEAKSGDQGPPVDRSKKPSVGGSGSKQTGAAPTPSAGGSAPPPIPPRNGSGPGAGGSDGKKT